MYCRFCGSEIKDDSIFCSFCGKSLNQTNGNIRKHKRKLLSTESFFSKLSTETTSNMLYISLCVFWILWWKMAPSIGLYHFIFFISGVALTIFLTVLVEKWRKKCHVSKSNLIVIICCLVLLIPSISLRIVYEAKVDDVNADIPSSGQVYVKLDIDDDYYTYGNPRLIDDPTVSVKIGDNLRDGNHISNIFKVELNKKYTAIIGVENREGSGSSNKIVEFTSNNLKNGYLLNVGDINMGWGTIADITVRFERICLFWEVIFY